MNRRTGSFVIISACVLLLTAACSDHRAGYQHGYANTEPDRWIVFGRQDYRDGYEEGRMQAFHDDWYVENEQEMQSGLTCPAVVVQLKPAAFTQAIRRIDLK